MTTGRRGDEGMRLHSEEERQRRRPRSARTLRADGGCRRYLCPALAKTGHDETAAPAASVSNLGGPSRFAISPGKTHRCRWRCLCYRPLGISLGGNAGARSACQSPDVDRFRTQLGNQRVHDAGRIDTAASEDVQREICALGIGMNGGMRFRQKDHPRKSRATVDEVMFHTPDGVKACLRQRVVKNTHDPIAITQKVRRQPRHVGDQMPSKDFSTHFSKFRHPLVHTILRGLLPTAWKVESNDRNPWVVKLKRRRGSVAV